MGNVCTEPGIKIVVSRWLFSIECITFQLTVTFTFYVVYSFNPTKSWKRRSWVFKAWVKREVIFQDAAPWVLVVRPKYTSVVGSSPGEAGGQRQRDAG